MQVMRVLVYGIPEEVRSPALQRSIQQGLRALSGGVEPTVELCGEKLRRPDGACALFILVEGPLSQREKLCVASSVGGECAKDASVHPTAQWWYHGFEIDHLLD